MAEANYFHSSYVIAVAELLGKNLNCTVETIEPVKPYDGDYESTIQRWRNEVGANLSLQIGSFLL